MRKLCTLLVPITLLAVVSAAPSARAASSKITLTAHLSGKNEVGKPGPSRGRGTATITITLATGKLCYNLSVSGFKLPAVAAHIHTGHAGKNGLIVVPFGSPPGTSGHSSGCTTVRSSLLKGITGHPSSYYVNVHTAAYPDGAVRGQLGMM